MKVVTLNYGFLKQVRFITLQFITTTDLLQVRLIYDNYAVGQTSSVQAKYLYSGPNRWLFCGSGPELHFRPNIIYSGLLKLIQTTYRK